MVGQPLQDCQFATAAQVGRDSDIVGCHSVGLLSKQVTTLARPYRDIFQTKIFNKEQILICR